MQLCVKSISVVGGTGTICFWNCHTNCAWCALLGGFGVLELAERRLKQLGLLLLMELLQLLNNQLLLLLLLLLLVPSDLRLQLQEE